MNILMPTTVPADALSGVATVFHKLRASLARRGHRVELINREQAGRWTQEWTRRAVAPLRLFGPEALLYREHWKGVRRLKAACRGHVHESFDIIHAHDVASGALAGKIFGGRVPCVVTCHFNDHPVTEQLLQNGCDPRGGGRMRREFNRWFAQVDNYHCVSDYVAEKVRRYAPGARRIRVIPNAVDVEDYQSCGADPEVRDWLAGRKAVVNIGHMEARKNQALLVRVLRHLPEDICLCLVGDGPDRRNLESLSRQSGVSPRVLFTGQRADVAAVLKSCHVYFQSSLNENCPMVLLEAAACGLPVLALAVGGIPGMFPATGGASLLPVDSTEAVVAGRIREVLGSGQGPALAETQRSDLGLRLSYSKMLDEMLSFYRECMEDGRNM
jgi:glycogen synthase